MGARKKARDRSFLRTFYFLAPATQGNRASWMKGYEVRRKRTDDIFITYACSSNNLNLTLLFSFFLCRLLSLKF